MTNKKEFPAYETDASGIEGKASSILLPESKSQVQKAVRENSSITIRGGGSGLAGGAVPQNCAVLDLSKLNKVLEFNKEKKTITVEPGIILDELNYFLEQYNLEFPVKPSSHSICTIGGMIATNAVGNRAVKYGKTSNWLESIEIVNSKGELEEVGKTDLGDFAGMEGITGVIVQAKLKLARKVKRTASLLSADSLDQVTELVSKLKLVNDVSAIEFLDRLSSSLLDLDEKYHLLVEFESSKGELKDSSYTEMMAKRDSLYPILANAGYTHIEDPKVLLVRFKELAELLEKMKVPYFGHLGVGIIHPVFPQNSKEKINKMLNFVRKLHGQVTGEHGIGLSKREFLEPSDRKLIERIKKRRDSLLKFNCGKVVEMTDEVSKKIFEEKEEVNVDNKEMKISEERELNREDKNVS